MNVLITGGAGYIGSNVALSLIDANHKVTIIDNLITGSKKVIPTKAQFYNLDISDQFCVRLKCLLKCLSDLIRVWNRSNSLAELYSPDFLREFPIITTE